MEWRSDTSVPVMKKLESPSQRPRARATVTATVLELWRLSPLKAAAAVAVHSPQTRLATVNVLSAAAWLSDAEPWPGSAWLSDAQH